MTLDKQLIALLIGFLTAFLNHPQVKGVFGALWERAEYALTGKSKQMILLESSSIINDCMASILHKFSCMYVTLSIYHNGKKIGVYQKYTIRFEQFNRAMGLSSIIRDYSQQQLSPYYKVIERMEKTDFLLYKDGDRRNSESEQPLYEISQLGAGAMSFTPIRINGKMIACLTCIYKEKDIEEDTKLYIYNQRNRIVEALKKSEILTKI